MAKRDYDAAIDLSQRWNALEPLLVGLGSGDMEIQRTKPKDVWITTNRRPDIETLDILLSRVTIFEPPVTDPKLELVDRWIAANAGLGSARVLLNNVPDWLLEIVWRDVENLLSSQGLSMPEETDLGGLNIAEARTCYAYLLAQLRLNHVVSLRLQFPDSMIWGIRLANLLRVLTARVGDKAAKNFLALMTYAKGRSPVSAPMIPHGSMLLIPYELVSPIAFERTLLRAAVSNPTGVGKLGNLLGLRANRWGDRFRSIPGCHVATQVLVTTPSGRRLGDFDLVVWDPDDRRALMVETKWPVDAASLMEGYKVDSMVDKGRNQLMALRAAIEAGEGLVKWPRGWDIPPDINISWWVGTAQQLDSRPDSEVDGILATSLRFVEHLLPAHSLEDLLTRVNSFPLPRRGLEYDLRSQKVRAGDLTIHFKALELLGSPPKPPAGRSIQHGWT